MKQSKPSTTLNKKLVKKQSSIEGKPLLVSASTGEQYAKSITAAIKILHQEIIREVSNRFTVYAQDGDLPEGGNLISQLRILFNQLLKKYNPIFSLLAKKSTERMIDRVLKNSSSTLKMSLREMGNDLAVKTDFINGDVKNVTQIATIEAVGLIKIIPQRYLSDVQKVVFESITTGKGASDLKRSLEKYYQGNKRRAELTALDQTRKAYANIQSAKLKSLGIKKFQWIHSGGGNEPRQLHVDMHGKVFDFDDPPFIGVMYGESIHGLPGTLPNCRCLMKPIFNFEQEEDD